VNVYPCKAQDLEIVNPEKSGWKLTFNDEFNGPNLDTTKWFTRYLGFRTDMKNANSNYFFEDGCLVLEVNEAMSWKVSSIQTAQGNFHQWKRSEINHFEPYRVKFAQEYGYFEIRAKGQDDRSGHSAFWLNSIDTTFYSRKSRSFFNKNYWKFHEIDIFENFQGNKFKFNLLSPPNFVYRKERTRKYSFNYNEDFHIYALEWDSEHVKYYVDNRLMAKYKSKNIAEGPLFIYLSLYANSWGTDGSENKFPSRFHIDYIRVYEREGK
jgi:beta-glucanase (GH16 family)